MRPPTCVRSGALGVGLDNIDTANAKARGVAVFPATGGNVTSVAEYVITAVLVAASGRVAGQRRCAVGRMAAPAHDGAGGRGRDPWPCRLRCDFAQATARRAQGFWACRLRPMTLTCPPAITLGTALRASTILTN